MQHFKTIISLNFKWEILYRSGAHFIELVCILFNLIAIRHYFHMSAGTTLYNEIVNTESFFWCETSFKWTSYFWSTYKNTMQKAGKWHPNSITPGGGGGGGVVTGGGSNGSGGGGGIFGAGPRGNGGFISSNIRPWASDSSLHFLIVAAFLLIFSRPYECSAAFVPHSEQSICFLSICKKFWTHEGINYYGYTRFYHLNKRNMFRSVDDIL